MGRDDVSVEVTWDDVVPEDGSDDVSDSWVSESDKEEDRELFEAVLGVKTGVGVGDLLEADEQLDDDLIESRRWALVALLLHLFLGEANFFPRVLSGIPDGSPFLKCLLQILEYCFTALSDRPMLSIHLLFLASPAGNRCKDMFGSLAFELPHTTQRLPVIL